MVWLVEFNTRNTKIMETTQGCKNPHTKEHTAVVVSLGAEKRKGSEIPGDTCKKRKVMVDTTWVLMMLEMMKEHYGRSVLEQTAEELTDTTQLVEEMARVRQGKEPGALKAVWNDFVKKQEWLLKMQDHLTKDLWVMMLVVTKD